VGPYDVLEYVDGNIYWSKVKGVIANENKFAAFELFGTHMWRKDLVARKCFLVALLLR
jgi:hypothetical protein